MSEKPKPCPSCGGESSLESDPIEGTYAVVCWHCGHGSPDAYSEDEAAFAWNHGLGANATWVRCVTASGEVSDG